MAKYVDGFVIPVPKDKIDEYRKIAELAADVWQEHGALEYRECVGEDLHIKDMLPFPSIAGAKEGETVIFSWIMYESRAHRDDVNAKVMKDPRLASMCEEGAMPFDCKRMAYGGFEVIVER